MFASLKNKIKEETGNEVPALPVRPQNSGGRHVRGRLSSATSVASLEDVEQKEAEIASLRLQINELTSKFTELSARIETLEEEKDRLEKTNEILLESVKVAQTQKDLICEEKQNMQSVQQAEITKLKSLLSFREQEAVDRLSVLRQNQQQIDHLKAEVDRLKIIEPISEELKDDLERLRHSSQLDKNNLTTILAALEEENRHLKSRLQIVDQSRLDFISTLSTDEKIQALVQERKLLEQHLEEAHLQLSDIKSSWSGQNLALETQVSRLSIQVAEETTEKRKAIAVRDEISEKVKRLEFDVLQVTEELKQRDNKIQLLEEQIDELASALRECRIENEEEVTYLRNKVQSSTEEITELLTRLASADERFSEYVEQSEQVTNALRKQNSNLQQQLQQISNALEVEKQEKLTALLRNAEISQSEEILKKNHRMEMDELEDLQNEVKQKADEISELKLNLEELNTVITSQKDRIGKLDELTHEVNEKNKTIKVLNQRLADLKKTLQNEIKSSNFSETNVLMAGSVIGCDKAIHESHSSNGSSGGPVIMDEVNFKYLKHVIVKFLTSREVEARHLIRAVATLLHLNHDEEKLLHDTLNWKMSWFGSKPDHGHGQQAFSIPPS